MKRNRKILALLLAAGMLISSIGEPATADAAKKKKPSVSTAKKTYTVEVGKSAKIQVKTKKVKKITSVKAKSSAKKNIKVSKVRKSKKKATVTVKALKAKRAKVTITVKYKVAGKKKTYTKKLKVTVKGKAKGATGTKTPTATKKPGSTPTKAPQSTATAVPTTGGGVNASPAPTASPTAKPTASPTVRPTLRPTKAPVTANLVSVTNYKGTGEYCVEVTLDGEVDLAASDFAVTRTPYKGTEAAAVTGFEISREGAKSYVLNFSGTDVMWGDTLTVTIDSLTGTKKTGSVVKTGFGDGMVRTENLMVKAGTEGGLQYFSRDDGLYGDITYTPAQALPDGITMQEMEKQTDEDTGLVSDLIQFSVADSVNSGVYTITLNMTDEIGTKVTRSYIIMVVSETEIQVNQNGNPIVAEGGYFYREKFAVVAGGFQTETWTGELPYTIQAEEIVGDANTLSWEIELDGGAEDFSAVLLVSGDVLEERTYNVTVSVTDNPEIKKTIQVTVKPSKQVKVSGTLRYMNDNAPVDDLDANVSFKNKETGQVYGTDGGLDEGTYEILLPEGTYTCYAVFHIMGKAYYFYRTEDVEITSQSGEMKDIDILCQIAAAKVDLTEFSDKVILQDVPEDFSEPGCRLVVHPEAWYDKDNAKIPGDREVTLLPGEYDLYADNVTLYASNEYVEGVESGAVEYRSAKYWYQAEAHIIVTPEKITVEAVYKKADMEAQKTATMDMASGKVSFAAGTENQVVKVTPAATGVYEIYAIDENMGIEDLPYHHQDGISVYREDGLGVFVSADGSENTTVQHLEAGKSYYVILSNRCGEACNLMVAATQQRKVTGQVKDAEGNVLTFPGETVRLSIYSGNYRERAELKADGSYEGTLYLGSSSNQYGEIYLYLPGNDNMGIIVNFDITEGDIVKDIILCAITVQPPEKYKDCQIVYDDWRCDETLGWSGNVLYMMLNEDSTSAYTANTKVTITEPQGGITTTSAFISFNDTGNQTVTAEFKDWEPDTDTVAPITAGKPVTEVSDGRKWYSFTPETDGLYELDITNSIDNWYQVYDRYGEYVFEENYSEEYTGEPLIYRMKAEEKYFIDVYSVGEYTFRVDKK